MYPCGCGCVCIMTVRYVGVIGYHGVRLAQGLGDFFFGFALFNMYSLSYIFFFCNAAQLAAELDECTLID